MSISKNRNVLNFSVGSLLNITAAIAVGLAVSQSPPLWGNYIETDRRWLQGLMSSGVTLLVCELLRQVFLLSRLCRTAEPEAISALLIALFQRLTLSLSLLWLLILHLLLSRQVIERVVLEHHIFYFRLWPNLMLTITILATIRILLVSRDYKLRSVAITLVSRAIVFAGGLGIAIFIITDTYEWVAMSHFITYEVENRSPIAMQHPGLFPNHSAEGFRSFWLSTTAAIGVVLAGGLLWLHARTKQPLIRIVVNAILLLLFLHIGFYIYWYVYHEFPRISPYFAIAGTSRIQSDAVCWWVLTISLAMIFGLKLARMRFESRGMAVNLPSVSPTGALAVYLIVIASGLEANIRLAQFASDHHVSHWFESFSIWFMPFLTRTEWPHYICTIAEAALQVEALLPMLLFVSTISLAWQTIRNPNAEPSMQPITGKHVLCYSLASLALLIVAVPTLAIFGFCYWLGPFVL